MRAIAAHKYLNHGELESQLGYTGSKITASVARPIFETRNSHNNNNNNNNNKEIQYDGHG